MNEEYYRRMLKSIHDRLMKLHDEVEGDAQFDIEGMLIDIEDLESGAVPSSITDEEWELRFDADDEEDEE